MATLGRPATGLPRYYLDVGWHRHRRFAGLGVEALFCWQAAVGYATEHATDGRLPGDLEDLSLALGVKLSVVKKGVRQLVDRDLWRVDGDDLVIDGWVEHNPTSVEVEEHTERQRSRGNYGNHKRWHEGRGRIDPNCPYCNDPGEPSEESQDDSPGESPGDDPQAMDPQATSHPPSSPGESLGMGWDGMGTTSSSRELTSGDSPPDDEDQPPPTEPPPEQGIRAQVETALSILARHDLDERLDQTHIEPVNDPRSWERRAYSDRRQRHADELTERARTHPELTPQQLAEPLLDSPTSQPSSNPPAPDPGWRAVETEEQTRQRLDELRQHEPPPEDLVHGALATAREQLPHAQRRPEAS